MTLVWKLLEPSKKFLTLTAVSFSHPEACNAMKGLAPQKNGAFIELHGLKR